MPPPLHQRRGDLGDIGGGGGGLHLLAPSEDGHVYVIEGATGCVNKIDLGERVRSMVLTDDVDGDGTLDLVVGTMSGEVRRLSHALGENVVRSIVCCCCCCWCCVLLVLLVLSLWVASPKR